MTSTPDLRIGDADREASAASLREHYAQGRLSLEEFNERLDAVFAATTQSQLDQITGDLPHVRTPSVPLPVATVSDPPHGGRYGRGSRRGARSGLGMVISMACSLAAILAIWFVVLSPTLFHFRIFSLPGRFSVLFIALMVIRSLFRRIFGGRRGWGGGCGRPGRFDGPGNSGRPW